MALVTTDNAYYTAIAGAIRAKNGESSAYTPSQMAAKIAAITTGAELGFTVTGGATQPDSPTEGLIWVNTDTEITGWVFASAAPESPAEGNLWFATWLTSDIQLNALRQNGIWVYPVCCQQYVSGAWTAKGTKIYSGGAWQSMDTYLIRDGAKRADFTLLTKSGGAAVTDVSVNEESGCIDFVMTSDFVGGGLVTSKTLDTISAKALHAAYESVCLKTDGTANTYGALLMGVTTETAPYISNKNVCSEWLAKTSVAATTAAGTLTLDLTDVSELSRVVIGVGVGSNSAELHTRVTDLWLE